MLLLDPEPVSDGVLRHAIELRLSDCFPAMMIANALAGSPTPAWQAARKFTLASLIEEALDRGLPVHEFRAAVGGHRLVDCRWYHSVRDEIGGRPDFPA